MGEEFRARCRATLSPRPASVLQPEYPPKGGVSKGQFGTSVCVPHRLSRQSLHPFRLKSFSPPASAGTNPHRSGLVEKAPERVKATPLKGKPHKVNPPCPPCQGGRKKQSPLCPAGAHRLFIPPCQGGVGGVGFQGRGMTSPLYFFMVIRPSSQSPNRDP